MVQYIYQPLRRRSIRLLRLLPAATQDSPLEAELHHEELDPEPDAESHPEFEAISYAWGSNDKPFAVSIAGRFVPITASLDSFLRRVRYTSAPRVLWADAVCINQLDTPEKGHQVDLMPIIYGTARRVLVDLGEQTADSDAALDLMDRAWRRRIWSGSEMGGGVVSPQEQAFYLGVELPADRDAAVAAEIPADDDPRWRAAAAFFVRPWFSRLWVVQEFALARDPVLLCGRRSIPWQHLMAAAYPYVEGSFPVRPGDAVSVFRRNAFLIMASIRRLRALRQTEKGRDFLQRLSMPPFSQWFTRCRFLDLLHLFQISECSNERDRYFALKGLADDVSGSSEVLNSDYQSPTEVVVTRVGRFLVARAGGEEMLIRAGLCQQLRSDVASWIQDFTSEDPQRMAHRVFVNWPHRASGDTQFRVTLSSERQDLITLRGIMIDAVDTEPFDTPLATLSSQSASYNFDQALDHVAAGIRALNTRDCAPLDAAQSGMLDAACFVMAFGSSAGTMATEESLIGFSVISWLAVWRGANATQWIYSHLERRLGVPRATLHSHLTRYVGHVFQSALERLQPARTRRGYFASLPSCFRPGDEVWVVEGGRMPLLLRRSAELPGCYRLVGSCCVYGFMEGEVLGTWRKFRQVSLH